MRVEPGPLEAVYAVPVVMPQGSEPTIENPEHSTREEESVHSDYMYALSTGSLINIQV
ncbi:hypothetical protein [Leptospira perolatii]|uniref:hypothetical protein n=1 Tax=Leptospira perolatii TaxID=2023191 RepID=UPI0013FE2F33|nr:hypothetical protein [Leptospira perolatii]